MDIPAATQRTLTLCPNNIVAKWLHALESGKYQHCLTFIHPEVGMYCAYGVLCDLFVNHYGYEWTDNLDTYYSSRIYLYAYSTRLPPWLYKLIAWNEGLDHTVVRLNDNNLDYSKVVDFLKITFPEARSLYDRHRQAI